VADAASYALSNGGKRVRPLLIFGAARAVDHRIRLGDLAHPACAIELIHTYSLIHDDLPAMDDDDLRRGVATLHKVYDEATAILVGDGLQARAFELIADAPGLSCEQKIQIIKVLAEASGLYGMVGGQYIDITSTGRDLTLQQLQAMHALKTGALIRTSLAMGGIAAGADEAQLAALDEYGSHIGLAFQVVDDILDVEGDTATLGKTQGKDGEANKPTYVKLLGLDGARAEARSLLQAALAALDGFGGSADHLRDLARYMVERDR
jgi:geranylgeranyl pyrophosphate synthase